jgi:anti-sigma-K factor RskA
MRAADLLDQAKEALCLKSDYALAKASGIPRNDIPAIRTGKRAVPLHLAYWLAITLQLDPAQVVAELEEEREKNPTRAAFWRSFLLRAASRVVVACTLVVLSLSNYANAPAGIGGTGFNRRRSFA